MRSKKGNGTEKSKGEGGKGKRGIGERNDWGREGGYELSDFNGTSGIVLKRFSIIDSKEEIIGVIIVGLKVIRIESTK